MTREVFEKVKGKRVFVHFHSGRVGSSPFLEGTVQSRSDDGIWTIDGTLTARDQRGNVVQKVEMTAYVLETDIVQVHEVRDTGSTQPRLVL
jgi:hypothetical protein